MRGLLAAMIVASVSNLSSAEVVNLFPAQDNTLYIHETGDLSNGSGISMFVGVTRQGYSFGARRALCKFDVASAVPAGATITRVNISLAVTRSRGTTINIGAHRLLSSWGESFSRAGDTSGGSGDIARPGDATWVHRFASNTAPVLWNTPGGDFVSTASATTPVGAALGRYNWSSAGLIADVQLWLNDPSTNAGWLFKSNELGTYLARRFGTREDIESQRPILTIEYTIPAPASAAVALLFGLASARRRR